MRFTNLPVPSVPHRPRLMAASALTLAMALAGCSTSADDSPGKAEPPPSTSASTPVTPATSPTSASEDSAAVPLASDPFRLSGLPTGVEPAGAWSNGRDLHLPDTTLTGILPDKLDAFAPMGSGVMAQYETAGGRSRVEFFNADGTPGPRSFRVSGGLVTSPAGEAVAWVHPNGTPMVVQSEGDERFKMPRIVAEGRAFDAVAVTGEDCQEGGTNDAGCSVIVNVNNDQPQAWFSASHGFAERAVENVLTMTAWRDGGYAGITEYREDGSTCSAVGSLTSAEVAFSTCEHRLVAFSPDGSYLLAVGSTADGLGDGEIGIVDAATGEVLVNLVTTPKAPTFATEWAWEDQTHLLLVAYSQGAWSIVRLGIDGSMEYAVPPMEGSDLDSPLHLSS